MINENLLCTHLASCYTSCSVMAWRTTALLITAAMAVVVVGPLLPVTTSADTYVVGDDDGWDLRVDYSEWASQQTLYVGDILKFEYDTGGAFPHNVVMVDEESFEACTVPSNAFTMTSGDDTFPLFYTGQYYFISSLRGDCQSGMKLNVNVAQQPGSDG